MKILVAHLFVFLASHSSAQKVENFYTNVGLDSLGITWEMYILDDSMLR